MSYLVLARKYRPQTFDQVVGQQAITRTLQNAIRQDRVSHAFLFTGPRGVGKTTMARLLAKALNCAQGPTPNPCGVCTSCQEITAGASVDVIEIDGASNRGIDNIRELREAVKYMPAGGKFKIYIIDEVHMLTEAAFNALLKTLEEPPRHVVFIFATTEPHKVLVTIQSRCQRHDFRLLSMQEILERLYEISRAEALRLSEKALRIIAREARGSMRDALSLLDQVVSFAGPEPKEEEVAQILDIVDRQHLFNISQAVLNHDARAALEVIEELNRQGCDFKNLTAELMAHFRNLAIISQTTQPERLIDLDDDELQRLKDQAASTTPQTLQLLFDLLARTEEDLFRTTQPRWILEMTLVKMAMLRPVIPLEEILNQIKDLEKRLRAESAHHETSRDQWPALFEGVPPAPQTAETSKPQPADSRSWEDFLKFVEERDHKLHLYLSGGKFVDLKDKQLQVEFNRNSAMLQRLQNKGSQEVLDKLLEEYMGPGFKLVLLEKENARHGSAPSSLQEKDRLRREAMSDPAVEAVQRELEAEIKEIKIK